MAFGEETRGASSVIVVAAAPCCPELPLLTPPADAVGGCGCGAVSADGDAAATTSTTGNLGTNQDGVVVVEFEA